MRGVSECGTTSQVSVRNFKKGRTTQLSVSCAIQVAFWVLRELHLCGRQSYAICTLTSVYRFSKHIFPVVSGLPVFSMARRSPSPPQQTRPPPCWVMTEGAGSKPV